MTGIKIVKNSVQQAGEFIQFQENLYWANLYCSGGLQSLFRIYDQQRLQTCVPHKPIFMCVR